MQEPNRTLLPCSEKYADIFLHLLKNGALALTVSQIPTIRHVIQRHYPRYLDDYLALEKRARMAKTPSYVDFDHTTHTGKISKNT